jgi:hypothetical protein
VAVDKRVDARMMVVVGRKCLALLMTTNRVSANTDTRFGCGHMTTGFIEVSFVILKGCVV